MIELSMLYGQLGVFRFPRLDWTAIGILLFELIKYVVVDETSLIIALGNKTTSDDLTECVILEFDEDLPDKLLKRPLMFDIYDGLPILKLCRSAYISSYQWKN